MLISHLDFYKLPVKIFVHFPIFFNDSDFFYSKVTKPLFAICGAALQFIVKILLSYLYIIYLISLYHI